MESRRSLAPMSTLIGRSIVIEHSLRVPLRRRTSGRRDELGERRFSVGLSHRRKSVHAEAMMPGCWRRLARLHTHCPAAIEREASPPGHACESGHGHTQGVNICVAPL